MSRVGNPGVAVYFTGINPEVRQMFDRADITALVGADAFFFNALDAIGMSAEASCLPTSKNSPASA